MGEELFKPVKDESEIKAVESGGRGRFSYPIIKMFLESGEYLVKLNKKDPRFKKPDGTYRTKTSISSSLGNFCKKNIYPVQVFQRGGEVYLKRLDVDSEGNEIPDWKDKMLAKRKAKKTSDIVPDEDKIMDLDEAVDDHVEEE